MNPIDNTSITRTNRPIRIGLLLSLPAETDSLRYSSPAIIGSRLVHTTLQETFCCPESGRAVPLPRLLQVGAGEKFGWKEFFPPGRIAHARSDGFPSVVL